MGTPLLASSRHQMDSGLPAKPPQTFSCALAQEARAQKELPVAEVASMLASARSACAGLERYAADGDSGAEFSLLQARFAPLHSTVGPFFEVPWYVLRARVSGYARRSCWVSATIWARHTVYDNSKQNCQAFCDRL